MYGFQDPDLIDSQLNIKNLNQLKIFEDLFQQGEIEFDIPQYYSIFRDDKTPDTSFRVTEGGIILYVDFGDPRARHRNCVEAVAEALTCDNATAMAKIRTNQYYTEIDLVNANRVNSARVEKQRTVFFEDFREFDTHDIRKWNTWLISKEKLTADGVRAISRIFWDSRRSGPQIRRPKHGYLIYHEADFKKYYLADTRLRVRFLANTSENCVGNLKNIDTSKPLTINKSYKDNAVVTETMKDDNMIWNQSESCTPTDPDVIYKICACPSIHLLYDNDLAGREGILNQIAWLRENNYSGIISYHEWSSNYNDPAHMISKEGRAALKLELQNGIKYP